MYEPPAKIRSHISAPCLEGGSACVAHWTGASFCSGVESNSSCFGTYIKLSYIPFSQRSPHSLGLLCDNISKQSVGQSMVRDQGSSVVPTALRMFHGMFFLAAGFLLFTFKPQAKDPFPSGHRAASACFATASQNSRLAKARSGIRGVKRSRRQALPAKRSAGLQNPNP